MLIVCSEFEFIRKHVDTCIRLEDRHERSEQAKEAKRDQRGKKLEMIRADVKEALVEAEEVRLTENLQDYRQRQQLQFEEQQVLLFYYGRLSIIK